ncbi:glycosyl hydrolase 2 galactose-binding domain-containing protein [Caulobacter sp. ErkDOM-YI]|uniref:glycosyl hydrolase 2 galactose-binding domain-containing protein n=1 Tax=unclassified Caulobacter TaxID=2648921 RepID=UPI003AF7C03D
MGKPSHFVSAMALIAMTATAGSGLAQTAGPFNFTFPAGGDEIARDLPGFAAGAVLPADSPWSLSAWMRSSERPRGPALIAGVGDPTGKGRYLVLDASGFGATSGGRTIRADAAWLPGEWHHVTAVFDGGAVRLFVDGHAVGAGTLPGNAVTARLRLAPRKVSGFAAYAGDVAGLRYEGTALAPDAVTALAGTPPNDALTVFDTGSPTWPVQVRQMYGQTAPQDPWTLPRSKAPANVAVAIPAYSGPALKADGEGLWTLKRWSLIDAPSLSAGGGAISKPGFNAEAWRAATVPGTVLNTLVDRGVYADPDHGLNNILIPESLNRQDYWYRATFDAPAQAAGKRLLLTFKGINYAAEVWLNGQKLGDIKGAFIRGQFDVTKMLVAGSNALAVRVSPPPHPGIAHEESLTAGVGENGGMMALDGPTFVASEGWDWIPSVRDRNTGIWQDVTLRATGEARIGDAQVVTTLPRADNSQADVEIIVPIENLGDRPANITVTAAFDGVRVEQTVLAPPGASDVRFTPAAFPSLAVKNPKLWWPNGYGAPALHALTLTVSQDGQASDERRIRFGMRQITYELSLINPAGQLRRVEVDFAKARQLGQDITDGSHEGIRKVPDGWATSLTTAGDASPAVRDVPEVGLSPHLVIKVNGRRIAARGGNWGMDDWRKRVERERLEPYFRLHKEANLNTIRNWVGQNTEEVFFDLADEYGLLVLNDFWASTQDYQLEPQDVPLFLANAADVIKRFRNHPSIALWFGRNEGVPQPILNEGLEALVHDLDGTRWYTGSSNRVNLQNSGPYNYREPESYFTDHAKGFSVEVGTPSFPTLEAFKAAVPEADRWPISDTWAYHDWHPTGNGAVKTFQDAMAAKLGPPTSLEDFERKAQLMNYETHRAMFEGMNAELWTRSSGRLLWMTHSAWPSTMWQIYSHDYDTHGAFYGVKKAAQTVHIQMSLADHRLALVNNGGSDLKNAKARVRVLALDGRLLSDRAVTLSAKADSVSIGDALDLKAVLASQGAVVVRLDLSAAKGQALSNNSYWIAGDAAGSRKLSAMTPQTVSLKTTRRTEGDETVLTAKVTNTGAAPALNLKLTLTDAQGRAVLPAYYSDNYLTLTPGEERPIEVRYRAAATSGPLDLNLRGWNAAPVAVAVP